MRENQKNYLERQKVRNLRSLASLRKQPTFRDTTSGFLRLVGRGGGAGHRLPTMKHFSVSLSFLKSKGEEIPLSILPSGYSKDISGLMEVSREFARKLVMPLPQRTRSSTGFAVGGVPQVISAQLLMLPAKSKVFLLRRGTFPHSSFVEVGFAPRY